ncbi:hypothetical protein JOF48_001786 [Arthrobacter stackebrandtii]|uniref:Uncharacterized protein n=1 Tax=Arthrobacter stackebrandtii TaxID=272161 RepID=A0ABS4YW19_9MICC|nr:hypothetical protein [Arthrobacter stackebrandtii]MBP2412987.1 hypothetical protein [Arthrobacter stackebrandtii]
MTAIPLAVGSYEVFVVTAQYTGLGFVESYRAFQGGSHLGNVISAVTWYGAGVLTCLWLLRGTARSGTLSWWRVAGMLLLAYGIPSLLVIYPDATMGFAVSHVRAFAADAAPHSQVLTALAGSGLLATAASLPLFAVDRLVAQLRSKEHVQA